MPPLPTAVVDVPVEEVVPAALVLPVAAVVTPPGVVVTPPTVGMVDVVGVVEPPGVQSVGVTAGASAPDVLVQEVVAKLRDLKQISLSVMEGIAENVKFRLPPQLEVSDRVAAK